MKNYKVKIIRLTLWIGFLTTFSSGQQPPATVRPGFSSRPAAIEPTPLLTPPRTIADILTGVDEVPVETGFEGCPLTLFLVINVAPGSALRYLETPRGRRLSDESANPESSRIEIVRETGEDLEF
jgi:hypothetical protein